MATLPKRAGLRRPKPKKSTFTTADFKAKGNPTAAVAGVVAALQAKVDRGRSSR
jgi:hypothetical protein